MNGTYLVTESGECYCGKCVKRYRYLTETYKERYGELPK